MGTKNGYKKLSRKAEDYLEAILNITHNKGYARSKDVAETLSVSPSSVVEMFRKLAAMDLVTYRKYEGVTLKPEGKRIAEVVKYRHVTLKAFLSLIHVPEDIADCDACIMEHELNDETIEQIKLMLDFLNSHFYQPDALEMFGRYCNAHKLEDKPASS